MGELNFNEYKNSLRQLLHNLGYDIKDNLINCINPAHADKNPSMQIYENYFKCWSCGCHGDVYDVIEITKGITDKVEQYKKVQAILGDSWRNINIKAKKKFEPDSNAEKKFTEYLVKNIQKNELNIKSYLKNRNCPEDMIEYMWSMFAWWPGYLQAHQELDKKIIYNAGIPGTHPETGKSKWHNPGVVLKLGKGFKLFFYDKSGKSQKMGTKSCKTFPKKMPDSNKIYIVEGEIEACSMKYAGYQETIACGGVNGISEEDIKKLLPFDDIYILFDNDKAGRTKREKLREKLLDQGYTGNIYIVRLPVGKDPDDMIKEGLQALLSNAISQATSKDLEIKKWKDENNQLQNNVPFRFLGYDYSNNYYVMPKNKNITVKIGSSNNVICGMMLDIAPADFWWNRFETSNEAVKWFREEQVKAGLYDPDSIKGVGAHFDENEDLIINCGNKLFHSNQNIDYETYEGEVRFRRSNARFSLEGDPWTEKQGLLLLDELGNYGFENKIDYLLLLGYISISPFASLLNRRPHLAVIGPHGCGKSTLVDNILRPALGKTGMYTEGGATEAAIRQTLGCDCRPVIIDEFEAHNEKEELRNKAILSLARSSYGGEGEIIKGSAGGKSVTYKIQSMFCYLGININFDNAADRSRTAILNMFNSNKKIGKTFDFSGLRRRTFNNFKRIQENIELAKKYIKENCELDSRAADTFGTLLAAGWSVISDCLFLQDGNESMNNVIIKNIHNLTENNNEYQNDENIIFEEILNTKLKIGIAEEMTIAEMFTENIENPADNKPIRDKILKSIGIRKDKKMKIDGKYYNALAISVNNKYIREILKDSPHKIYKNILLRHEGKIYDKPLPIRMSSGKKERCIVFNWEMIQDMYFDLKEDENLKMASGLFK